MKTPSSYSRDIERRDAATTPASLLRRHPLAGYFAMCFGISWGGILLILTATGFNLAALQPLETGLIFAMMLLGPSASGLTLTAVLDGRAGLHRLGSGLTRWTLGARWYAVALLTTPLFLLAILWPLGVVVAPAFAPRFHWPLLGVGLVAGGFEELGWTGFATPRLLARQRAGTAGLLLGLVWAFWHLLVDFRYNFEAMGVVWPLEFAVVYIATLTPYRMLMTWVYVNTGSVLLAILMHASYTGWLLVLFSATSLTQSLSWQAAFAIMLWLAVALVLRRSSPDVEAHGLARGMRSDVPGEDEGLACSARCSAHLLCQHSS
nr:type II CAAX endopeptidase family protein [uncultured Rhodopila sp.]